VSHKRQVWETVSDFLSQQSNLSGDELAALEKQVGKLGREQYKANTLAQAQTERLEAGLRSGGRHAYRLHRQGSPEAGTLTAWLDGQRLLRDRLLAILEAEGVKPIPTVGQPFDPYLHVAVGTVRDESRPDGQIVGEERRGYAAGEQVLRYAEVVVVRKA
jgi:hypothetical protein